MGYYNIFYIIKQILYALRGVLKYLVYALFLVVFIVICLLLMGRNSFAALSGFHDETFQFNGVDYTAYLADNAYNAIINSSYYTSGDYKVFAIGYSGNTSAFYIPNEYAEQLRIYNTQRNNNGWYVSSNASIISNFSAIRVVYRESDGNVLSTDNVSSIDSRGHLEFNNNNYWFTSDLTIYSNNYCSQYFYNANNTFDIKYRDEIVDNITYRIPEFVINYAQSCEEYSGVGSTYNLLMGQNGFSSGTDYIIYFIPIEYKINIYRSANEIFFNSTNSANDIIGYSLSAFGVPYNNRFTGSNQVMYREDNGKKIFVSTCPIYTDNTFTTIAYNSSFTASISPYLANFNNQNEIDALTSGQISWFVVMPGSISIDTDILFDVYNTTNADSADYIVKRYTLNRNSSFLIESETYPNGFGYFIPSFMDWFKIVNGQSYKIRLSWVNPSNPLQVLSEDYSWTMSLTDEQQETQEQITQQDINHGINDLNDTMQETNDFLKDDNYDKNNIVNNMPSSAEYQSPTESGIDNIFQNFMNAFTSNETQVVRFVIPFTNGEYIDIPSDLTISKLPSSILFLIQGFYWFIICRYIVKDISHTAEKAKSGEILDGGSDGNIKTDLL